MASYSAATHSLFSFRLFKMGFSRSHLKKGIAGVLGLLTPSHTSPTLNISWRSYFFFQKKRYPLGCMYYRLLYTYISLP
ncbi:uncharacterized protein BO66DRAFT_197132 [Aspergillus aculeatinus CBS 121060]|uniref:Uncharacterized protein n=1 Tax=Aspergillus aculeatinus CBS 121060 TaxID=1448322 RepID=A0ACD1GX49_9EURO|nr:hypothetical protein BO66DRAFT_197132 [Aspergillus aculeatinus CBS 121060]RAH65779.1 hypothetical protein BO66DRAFT_197132 [Aspergillus aculeatinus CBS 121060]